jgi:hypothetical protein
MLINPLNTHFTPHTTQFKAIKNQRIGNELFLLEKEMQELCRDILEGTISNAAEINNARVKMSNIVKQLGGYGKLSPDTKKLWSDQIVKPRGTTPEELARQLNRFKESHYNTRGASSSADSSID